MRYLIHESQKNELVSRKDYLYDIFRLYFLPGNPEGRYIPLLPVGFDGLDILFITGHTNQVQEYLEAQIGQIPEKNIVITSCFGDYFKRFTRNKTIFVPNAPGNFCLLRNGAPFGFDFQISDAELNFYNASGNIMQRIKSAYRSL